MILHSPTKREKEYSVIPAWIAGIQARRDASAGDVRVGVDSRIPCWDHATQVFRLIFAEPPPPAVTKEAVKKGWNSPSNQTANKSSTFEF